MRLAQGCVIALCVLFSASLFASAHRGVTDMAGAWSELPRVAHAGAMSMDLAARLEGYHALPKADPSAAPERVKVLQGFAEVACADPSKRVRTLGAIAARKAEYLLQISQVHNERGNLKLFPESLFEVMVDYELPPEHPSVGHEPLLTLVNKVMYDAQLPAYWGLFQLEVLDPCHRLFLTAPYLRWRETGCEAPFFFWLETQQTFSFKELQVTYLDPQAVDACKVTCQKGLLQDAHGPLSTQDDAEYLYLLTVCEDLFVVRGEDTIRHTSLSQGKSVFGAGSLKAKDGVLSYMDTESGHYFPTARNLLYTLRTLERQGLLLDWQSLQVGYYHEGVKQYAPAHKLREIVCS